MLSIKSSFSSNGVSEENDQQAFANYQRILALLAEASAQPGVEIAFHIKMHVNSSASAEANEKLEARPALVAAEASAIAAQSEQQKAGRWKKQLEYEVGSATQAMRSDLERLSAEKKALQEDKKLLLDLVGPTQKLMESNPELFGGEALPRAVAPAQMLHSVNSEALGERLLMALTQTEWDAMNAEAAPAPKAKPNYNHPKWPSPTTKRFAKHIAQRTDNDPSDIKTHEGALNYLAARANLPVDDLLKMSIPEYQAAHASWSVLESGNPTNYSRHWWR